jgi:hypothetical protein
MAPAAWDAAVDLGSGGVRRGLQAITGEVDHKSAVQSEDQREARISRRAAPGSERGIPPTATRSKACRGGPDSYGAPPASRVKIWLTSEARHIPPSGMPVWVAGWSR